MSSCSYGLALKLVAAAAAAKPRQSCPTLCDRMDSSPPGPPVPEILQARTLEWVAISFSNAWKWKVKVKSLSRVRLSAMNCGSSQTARLQFYTKSLKAFSTLEQGLLNFSKHWCHLDDLLKHGLLSSNPRGYD